MAKSRNQKGKLLYLAEIFHRETDEAHGLTLAELTERLAAYGVQAERKTLYADMEELRRCGLDIDSWKEGREYRYRLASRCRPPGSSRRASPAVSLKSWSRWSASTTPGSCSGRCSSPDGSRP